MRSDPERSGVEARRAAAPRTVRIRRTSLALLLGGVAATALAIPAYAQSKDATDDTVEEVVVTGSLFKQSVTGSQLVTTVSAEEIIRTGATSAVEALRTIAQNQPTVIAATSPGAGTGFASYANLRSLGSANTLVLFDSKRVVNNPYQSLGVDLNTLPLNLIDRVETLSDGASSIYGSDAIAGVVNFIPKRELTGLSVSVTRLQPEKVGGETTQASISGGIGSLVEDGWNIYGGYTWRKKEAFFLRHRDFAKSWYVPERGLNRLQGTTFPSNYSQGSLVNINPSRPACNPPFSIYIGGTSCQWNIGSENDAGPEQEDQSLLLHGTARLSGHTATLEYLRGESDLLSTGASWQINNASMSPSNPFFPGKGITPGEAGLNLNAPITVSWRLRELGPNLNRIKTDTDRLLGQVQGELAGWDYQAWALYSTSTVKFILAGNQVNVNRVRDGLSGANGATFLNPFGPQSAAGAQYLRDSIVGGLAQRAEAELTSYGGQLNRELFDLPAGPVQFAIAADYKDESSNFVTDPIAVTTQVFPIPTTIDASRESYSVTSEVRVPILRGLELDASLRYDHYSDFGGTTNPKVLLSWKARDWLTLRASYNKGFRAPTLYNVSAPSTLLQTRDRRPDPVLCPGGVVNLAAGGQAARDCGGIPYLVRTGGNADLGPEKSDAFSLGVALRPTESLTINVDYWNYHLKDTIAPLAESAIFSDLAKFGDLVVRCSQADPSLVPLISNCAPGHTGDPIAYVEQINQNLGETKTDGVDLNVSWSAPDTGWGQLTFDYHGTYVMNFDFQRVPDGPFFSRAGRYFDGFPVMDYSHYAALTWRKDDWTVQLSNRLVGGYMDCNVQCNNLAAKFHQKVDAYSLWNLSGTWEIGHVTVTGRISNLLNEDPPFTNKTQGAGTGWDERFSDPIGRAYSATVKYDF